MGKRKRQQKQENSLNDDTKRSADNVHVRQEPADSNHVLPEAWSIDFAQNETSEKSNLHPSLSLTEIGFLLARGTLDVMQKKNKKKGSISQVQLKASRIQLNMWPILLDSLTATSISNQSTCNIVGLAQTGSGKTLSYALPVVARCVHSLVSSTKQKTWDLKNSFVYGLVLCPTRELAIQVSSEMNVVMKIADKMLKSSDAIKDDCKLRVEAVPVYGGVDIEAQINSLGVSCDKSEESRYKKSLVVAATPGRLLDILKQLREKTDPSPSIFSELQIIVYDEADRMALNAEMASQIDEILSILHEQKSEIVSCLVSATLPHKTREIIDRWVPCQRVVIKIDSVNVGQKDAENEPKDTEHSKSEEVPDKSTEQPSTAAKGKELANLDLATMPSNLIQILHVCAAHKKPKKLMLTLQKIYKAKDPQEQRLNSNRLCIVFFAQIKTLKFVSKLLVKEGLKCVELFGTLKQEERERRLLSFKAGKFPILLASDIASRGIHVPNVHYVVNYDFPWSLDQYVHRCGRAGRNQKQTGATTQSPPTVYSFFTREFAPMADSVIELLRICNAHVDPNLLALSSAKKEESKSAKQKSGKRRKRKGNQQEDTSRVDNDQSVESDNDQFAHLGCNKIILKRASHVSDPEDSDSGGD